MCLNEIVRKKLKLKDDIDYLDAMYMKFISKERDYSSYRPIVYNDFGIYFNHVFPGLNSLMTMIDGDVMDMSPFEDDISNQHFVLFVLEYDPNDYLKLASMINGLGGEIDYVCSIFCRSKYPAPIRLFDENGKVK